MVKMTVIDKTKEQASVHLGKEVQYGTEYDPSLLVAVERIHNRTIYNIQEKDLPFIGYDTWHAYEISFLLDNGMPISLVAKIVYPSNSKSIVESKSLKLYFNSYNMTKLGPTKDEAIVNFIRTAQDDLSDLLGCEVNVGAFQENETQDIFLEDFNFIKLEEAVDIQKIKFDVYNESPEILQKSNISGLMQIRTSLLRSNCRITSQPDWGDAFIYIKSSNLPTLESLLQYIVSFRREDHFHEECAEMIYKRLYDVFEPNELMVTCIYTRRGGIDICPSRATHEELLSSGLVNHSILTEKTLRQ